MREAPIMAHQVDLHEAGLRLIPFSKGAHRDLLAQQRPRLGAAAPAQLQPPPLRSEQPVDRRRTDRAELLSRSRLELAVSFEHRGRLRQHRRQALAADAIHDQPHLPQYRAHRLIVDPRPLPRSPLLPPTQPSARAPWPPSTPAA